MRFNTRGIHRVCFSWMIAMIMACVSCDEHIIQRAASDYFQYEPGNWWQLTGTADTLYIEVELPDTVGQTEVMPVSYNGHARFIFEDDEGLYQYVSVMYTFSGFEYPVIEDFIVRIELPLVNGNTWHDSLMGLIEVSGQDISAQCHVWGSIIECRYSDIYDGDVYTIEVTTRTHLITPDTTVIDSMSILEEFAPGIGIVRFQNGTDEYLLTDYLVQ